MIQNLVILYIFGILNSEACLENTKTAFWASSTAGEIFFILMLKN